MQGERKGLVSKSVKQTGYGEGELVPEKKKFGNETVQVRDTSGGGAESGGTSLCCFPTSPEF